LDVWYIFLGNFGSWSKARFVELSSSSVPKPSIQTKYHGQELVWLIAVVYVLKERGSTYVGTLRKRREFPKSFCHRNQGK
jgi:hypothetical protein